MLKMTDFPAVQELLVERRRDDLLRFLKARFGELPETLISRVNQINTESRLEDLVDYAGECSSLSAFSQRLPKKR